MPKPKKGLDRFDLEAEREAEAMNKKSEIAPDRRNRFLSEEDAQEMDRRRERSKNKLK